MMSWLFGAFFILVLISPNTGQAEAWIGTKYCTPDLQACMKRYPGSTRCGDEYEKCMKSTGGVLQRDNGSTTQRYHPDNPQFKICVAKGLSLNSRAFEECMNGGGSTTAKRTEQPRATETQNEPVNQSPQNDGAEGISDTPAARACQAEFAQVLEKCEQESQAAVAACDSNNNEDVNSFSNTASQLALMVGQQTSASITSACTRMADLSQAANAAVAAYRLSCKSAQTSCFNSCSQVTAFISQRAQSCFPHLTGEELRNAMTPYQSATSTSTRVCESLDSKIEQAGQAIQNYTLTLANAANCRQETFGGTSAAAAEYCKANPGYPGCNPAAPVDCSKPENATNNKVCICSKNPQDIACTLTAEKAGGGATLTGNIDSSSRAPAQGSWGFNGDVPGTPSITHGKLGAGGPGEAVEGRQGGEALTGSGGSGGGGSAANGKAHGGEDSGEDAAVLGGYYGGSGGRGIFGINGNAGGAGGSGAAGSGKGVANGNGSPDLAKFLPGGQFDPRKMRGGVGPDGITGPHTNIWQKIQNRYQNVSPSLMP